MAAHHIGPAIVGLFAGLAIGALMAPSIMRDGSNGEGEVSPASALDRSFIEAMIPHHEGAIAMANTALARSKDQEIVALATNISKTQASEVEEMRAWYREWFGAPVPTDGEAGLAGHPGMRPSIAAGDVVALEAAEDINAEFVRQMVPHHEIAIVMARMLAAGSAREEMKTLAASIIATRASEVKTMKEWQEGAAKDAP